VYPSLTATATVLRRFLSKAVWDQVLDKLAFVFEELGAQKVKNIAWPVEAYRANLGAMRF